MLSSINMEQQKWTHIEQQVGLRFQIKYSNSRKEMYTLNQIIPGVCLIDLAIEINSKLWNMNKNVAPYCCLISVFATGHSLCCSCRSCSGDGTEVGATNKAGKRGQNRRRSQMRRRVSILSRRRRQRQWRKVAPQVEYSRKLMEKLV